MSTGLKDVILCDRKGAIYKGREGLNKEKEEIAAISNSGMKKGHTGGSNKGCRCIYRFQHPGFDKGNDKNNGRRPGDFCRTGKSCS